MPILPPTSGHLTSPNLRTPPAPICIKMGSEELQGGGGVAKETSEVKVQWSAQVTATSFASLPPPFPWVSPVSLQTVPHSRPGCCAGLVNLCLQGALPGYLGQSSLPTTVRST